MRTFLFLLAAVPAVFPAVGYLVVFVATYAEYVLGFNGAMRPAQGSAAWWVGWLSIHATFVQWPAYMIWVLFSKKITFRQRLAWMAILLFGNMLAFPWFLYCKYREQVWPPAGIAGKYRPSRLRWYQFSLRFYFLAFVWLAVVLTVVIAIVEPLLSLRVQTFSARLTSSGTVRWGNNVVSTSALRTDLARSARLMESHGLKSRFVIECYSDVNDSEIMKLKTIGRDAGFDIVDIDRLSWPSPEWSKVSD